MRRFAIFGLFVLGLLALRQPPAMVAYQGEFNPYSACAFDGQFLGLDTGQSKPWRCVDTGFPYGAQVGIFQAMGNTTLGNDEGATGSQGAYGDAACTCAAGGGTTNLDATSSEPLFIERDTGAVGDIVCIQSCDDIWMWGKGLYWHGYFKVTDTDNIRWWAGLPTDIDFGGFGTSATPAGHYAAFRYDTSVPDSNFKCVTNNNTTAEVNDSSVAGDTNGHLFEIVENAGVSIVFKIDGATVCTNSSKVPSSTNTVRQGFGGKALNATPKKFDMSWSVARAQ
jgi:hypothetical protein